jgi:hypothetical protein
MATQTFYPDASPETTSVDGYVAHDEDGLTFSALVASAGNTVDDSGVVSLASLRAGGNIDKWKLIYRGIFLFDTSSLTNAAVIDSATFSLYATSIDDSHFNQSLSVVSSNPASNTALANGDYATTGTTRFASDIDFGSVTLNAYNDFSLNASGLAAISKTGITKLAVRCSGDVDDSAPAWSDSEACSVLVSTADAGSNMPKLVVNYHLLAGNFFLMF